ncbi:hypothetical protein HCUR_00481 [Holospora curviuscula]|uniref:Uncharacterized protein n=1 Tax=Holospora curviuscula TaxID=1082868 RepID=A0A2S5RAH3_9PROT|nr:hypothetical protein HCUR_00481 [Holospora curviuscula]
MKPLRRSHGSAGLAEIREGLNAHPFNGPGHRLGAVAALLYIYIMRRFRSAPIPGNAPVALRLQYPLALHLRALMEDGPHPAGDLLRLNGRGMKYRAGARILFLVYPKGKAHPKEFSHHGHGVLGILVGKKRFDR